MGGFFERRHLEAFRADLDRIRPSLDTAGAKALLDVGGGSGVITEALAAGVPRVVVVEPNPKKRAKGAKRRPSIEFLGGQAEKLPAPDASFDRVLSFVAFHHFHEQTAALGEMRRVLAPGGRLVLFEFRPDNAPGPLWTLLVGHTHFLRADDLAQMVRAAGFLWAQVVQTPSGYAVTAGR